MGRMKWAPRGRQVVSWRMTPEARLQINMYAVQLWMKEKRARLPRARFKFRRRIPPVETPRQAALGWRCFAMRSQHTT